MKNASLPALCPSHAGPGAQAEQWGCLELQHSCAKDGRIGSAAQDLWDQSFGIVRQDVYEFPSGAGPWCPSLSQGHRLTLEANSKQQTALAWHEPHVFVYAKSPTWGWGLSAGCAFLLLQHPRSPLSPALTPPWGRSRGSLGLPAPNP